MPDANVLAVPVNVAGAVSYPTVWSVNVNLYTARAQLSKDIGDYFASVTTDDGAASCLTLIDDALQEQDPDRFVTKQAAVSIQGGQTGGPVTDEERGISSLAVDTITLKRAASVLLSTGLVYEVHRMFNAAEKDAALNIALNLCFPILWTYVQGEVTMVADQYDYDISALTIYRNSPHQVHLVSSLDTEITTSLFNWKILNVKYLHIGFTPIAGRKLRCFGIKVPAIANIDQPQLLILTARAAMYLYDQAMTGAPNDSIARMLQNRQIMAQTYAQRVAQYSLPTMPTTARSECYGDSAYDFDWRTA
jgi:hypothetical protein